MTEKTVQAKNPRFAWLWTEKTFNFIVTTAALLIMALPVGLATIWLGFMRGESPCTLCGYERFGMVVVAVLALFIMRYGPRRKYVFTLTLAAFFFLYTTVRHWGNHIHKDAGQGLAESVFGAHTYTWGVFVYWIVVLACGIAMLWIGKDQALLDQFAERKRVVKPLSTYGLVSGLVVLALILANSVQFFLLTGPPPFAGTGSPARFTPNVAQASKYWSASLWERVGIPQLHDYTPPMVHIPGENEIEDDAASLGAAAGPITDLAGSLTELGSTELGFEATGIFGDGNAAGIAYDAATDQFGIVSTHGGLYYVEDDFSTVRSSAVLDLVNGPDKSYTTDATFFGPGELIGGAWNKTIYGTTQVGAEDVDADVEWKDFRETTGDLMPVFGSRTHPALGTSRARSAYILSLAMDRDTGLYSVVSVPSPNTPDIVVSQFAADHGLSKEDVLGLGAGLNLRDGTELADYYPVGSDIADGKMYVLSRTYQTLLVVDMETVEVIEAWELPEIGDYHGIAIADDSMFVLSRDGGKDVVHELVIP
ncbi:MAG TPA: disulfide bond formation protein B [Actinomycetales bacterium]|nr:disulfide bond formation protein B [Actinomycetales bacterium]